jgi:hypothetical protein
MPHPHEQQENIPLEEFASGAHANNPLLHCDTCDEVPSSRIPVQGPYSGWAVRFTCFNVGCQEPGKDLISGMGAEYAAPSQGRE